MKYDPATEAQSSDGFGRHQTNVIVARNSGTQFWVGRLVQIKPERFGSGLSPMGFRCMRDPTGRFCPFKWQTRQPLYTFSAYDMGGCDYVYLSREDVMLIVAITADVVVVHLDETLYAVWRRYFENDDIFSLVSGEL